MSRIVYKEQEIQFRRPWICLKIIITMPPSIAIIMLPFMLFQHYLQVKKFTHIHILERNKCLASILS